MGRAAIQRSELAVCGGRPGAAPRSRSKSSHSRIEYRP
jgi:hypothetical protein